MDYIERLNFAWEREFGRSLPAEYVTRVECQTLTSENASSEILNKLTAAYDESENTILELKTRLRQEEIFRESVQTEISRQRQNCDTRVVLEGPMYAKVNKSENVPRTDSSKRNDKHLSEMDSKLTPDIQYDAEYEEIGIATNQSPALLVNPTGKNMEDKPFVVRTESLSGQKKLNVRGSIKDKIKIFEVSESSSSEESSVADVGDYEQLVLKSPPPSGNTPSEPDTNQASSAFHKRHQYNSYEEIALPFMTQYASDKPVVETGPSTLAMQETVIKTTDTSSTTRVEDLYKPSISQSPKGHVNQSGKTPPPIPARNYRNKEDFMENFRNKEAVPPPTFSDNEPSLSGSLGRQNNPRPDFNQSRPVDTGPRLSDIEPGGEYCSLKEAVLFKSEAGKHVTLVKVKSGGSDKSEGKMKHQGLGERRSFKVLSVKRSKELSKSTDDLSSVKTDTEHSSAPKEAKSIGDLCSSEHYDDVYIPDESDAQGMDVKKLFGHKNDGGQGDSQKIDVLSKHCKTPSTSSSEGGDDLMKTVPVQINFSSTGETNVKTTEGDTEERVEEGPKFSHSKKGNRKQVPDYEQWNFQALLTNTGISVADHEHFNDTASEDDNIYDNVGDKQENISGNSDDSGVSETTTPDEKSVAPDQTGEDSASSSPDLRKSNLSSRPSLRTSSTSCVTADVDSLFLHRSDSTESKSWSKKESRDEDSISVCSLDDQLDKPDGEVLPGDSAQYRSEQLRMRHLVAKGILESEKSYLHVVSQLVKAKHYLQSVAMAPHAAIAAEDVTTIFYKLDDIYQVHKEFVADLERKVTSWSDDQNIGDTFKTLVVYFKVYEEYVKNYQTAVETIHKYQENEETKQLFEDQMDAFKDEGSKLEDILLKPVQRIQTNNLVLHDLIKHTPEDHPDFKILQKALKLSEENLKTYNSSNINSRETPDSRHLVRSGFVVEVSRDKKTNRHLRYVFLFNDIIICTKHKGSSKPKEGAFKFVWCLPMSQLKVHVKGEKKYTLKDSLDDLKYKIGNLKIELREEMLKADSGKDKPFSMAQRRVARNIEKLKKKIQEQEATLVEGLPRLPLHLDVEGFRPHTFLFPTDYEREEWRDPMEAQSNKYCDTPPVQLTNHECEVLIATTKLHTQVNGIGTVLLKKDEEMLTGSLNVTIHKLQGLDSVCEVYCCLEMDSYGHFYKKATTRFSKYINDAAWDQDFELELDGSQTLRILCYKKCPETEDDMIVGKCALELSYSWLNSKFNEKTITMNEVSITVSIRHTPSSKTLKRTQSKLKTGIFGVQIGNVTKRESKTVPSIVTLCVQQVEARGLEEVGIYRVSGVTSDIQHLKKLFDKNPIAASAEAEVADIHAITGVLKLYFRELPEPLFTEQNYPSFIQSIELQNEEAKEKCMLELLHSLPEANYYTIVYIIEHLVRVSLLSKENKMSISNLSTIFGPTLLTPAMKEGSTDPMVQMVKAARDATVQSEVINFFLKLAASGKNIRKSAAGD